MSHPVKNPSSSSSFVSKLRSRSFRSMDQSHCPPDQSHRPRYHRSSSANHYRMSQTNGMHSGKEATTALSTSPLVDVKLNNIVGNGISGVLYKWVNYGKGWKPRWFVLQDGVLSYYKLRGPDRIVVSQETERGCKVIGEESLRIISHRRKPIPPHSPGRRKPFGEVHLKVYAKKKK
ncbi:hypothetical protein V6N13_075719 [Hibiscus sabdariffa]